LEPGGFTLGGYKWAILPIKVPEIWRINFLFSSGRREKCEFQKSVFEKIELFKTPTPMT